MSDETKEGDILGIEYKVVVTRLQRVLRTTESREKVADSGNERDEGAVFEWVTHLETRNEAHTIFEQRFDSDPSARIAAAANDLVQRSA